jgi:hypothetical protein
VCVCVCVCVPRCVCVCVCHGVCGWVGGCHCGCVGVLVGFFFVCVYSHCKPPRAQVGGELNSTVEAALSV